MHKPWTLSLALVVAACSSAPQSPGLQPRTNAIMAGNETAGELAYVASANTQGAGITIILTNEFIDKYRTLATIETEFTVDKAHKKPNAPSKDGDLHVAGRSDDIKLPMVAELMNARFEKKAMKAIHDAEGGGKVAMSGVWRIWCEHAGSGRHEQGKPVPPATGTNPDHVFEIHPVTKVGPQDTLKSLAPIVGYAAKDAERAFMAYESTPCQIKVHAQTTEIWTKGVGYNYVEFVLKPREKGMVVADGVLLRADVHTLDGDLVVADRRMIFVKGSVPCDALADLADGEAMHVLGLPRINLSLVKWRAQQGGETLSWDLPYEIVIVGFYEVVDFGMIERASLEIAA